MARQNRGSRAFSPAQDGAQAKMPAWRAVLATIMRVREAALVAFILVVSVVLTLSTPHFLTMQNMRVILTGLALDAVIAVGMTMVLVSGGVDLSVGSVFACSGIVVAKLFNLGWPAWAAVLGAMLVALFWGSFTGFLITKVGINPLISTLGVMGMARGVVYVITSGRVIAGLPDSFQRIGQGTILGIPNVI
ncbi:MAG: ABC transporter permease [Chloroflexi bacterium]|nr:ABC transporter permease [Chloroflexota bacterium]